MRTRPSESRVAVWYAGALAIGPVELKPVGAWVGTGEGDAVGTGEGDAVGTSVGLAVGTSVGDAVGDPSAMPEGVGVAWAPPEETIPAPTMRTATSAITPNPTKMGVELLRAGAGA
jgi:hypothetical protein